MRVKRFVSRTLPEAMVQVKAELGPDAVILHTNEIRVGGLFGLFGRRMIQVMAAVEERALSGPGQLRTAALGTVMAAPPPVQTGAPPGPPPARAPRSPAAPGLQPVAQQALQALAQREAARTATMTEAAPPPPEYEAVREEMAAMRAAMSQIMKKLDHSPATAPGAESGLASPASFAVIEGDPALLPLLAALDRGGVEGEAARFLVDQVKSQMQTGAAAGAPPLEIARHLMADELSNIQTVDGTHGRVIALIGPTGVGKTTTLAKLAAHLALQQRRKVALITADTYRIAAVEQLRTYSEIIGVPLEVVYDPRELQEALAAHRDRDVILVDTAGRSPRNPVHMAELKSYLDAMSPAETYLVMSLTSSHRDATAIAENYLPMGFDRFLFTKWDEAASLGLIYSVVHKFKRPLSYVTNGQNVPDDIEVADPQTVTSAILGD